MDIFSIIDFKSFSIIPKRFPKRWGWGEICSHELKITTGEKVSKEEHNMYST
jgi:hypothetical protein